MGTGIPPKPENDLASGDSAGARKDLKGHIDKQLSTYNRGTMAWSAVYNCCLIGAAALSAAAAVVVKVNFWKTNASDVAAIFAGVSALLNSLILGGGFDRKWRANRSARSKTKQLLVDLADPTSHLPDIRLQFKKIMDDQDAAVMGPR